MRINKWLYFYVLQGDYGHGWEDLTAGTGAEVTQSRREYVANEAGRYRIVSRKEPNPAFRA